ncbi:MAG TPA: helicase C-terminal domain-containing protein [Verrucomicrobiae bacterium]|nr:helicase C-terminal domain-containing protein [Verrucomicrobiae bacterium]
MARGVADSLARGRHLLVEAGTGVGKSLAYLVPAILHAAGRTEDPARRVIVSTFTRALQEQLARKDLPFLERAFEKEGIAFRHALLMGSENYLCVQRLAQARRDSAEDAFEALEQYAESAVSGLRSEIPFSLPEGTWSRVRREREVCLGSRGPFWERCLYRRDLQRAREAEILVVNHALFFLDLASGGRVLPPHGVVILDEAHRAEEAASGQLGARLGPGSVERLLRDILPAARGRRAPRDPSREPPRRRAARDAAALGGMRLVSAVRHVESESAGYFEAAQRVARQLAERDGPAAVRLPAGALDRRGIAASFTDLEEALEGAAAASDDLFDRGQFEGLRQRASDLRSRLEQFTTQPQADAVYWIETRGGARETIDLAFSPVEVGPILRHLLFESNRTVILTSATMTVGGSFAHARERLGVTASGTLALGSPFDYRRQALLYVPEELPDPGSDARGWVDAVSAECRRAIEASDGGALLLFTSYALLDRVHRDLAADEGMRTRPLLKHAPDGTATDLLERFRASRRAVLLGALTFWQGVDVPGEALRLVVVTRLPFEVPDHPLTRARAAAITARGGDAFQDDSLPEAILTFRQGFGRLIRSRRDYGCVAVLDPRLKSRAYGARFLESIPPCPVTSSIDEVARFYARFGAGKA